MSFPQAKRVGNLNVDKPSWMAGSRPSAANNEISLLAAKRFILGNFRRYWILMYFFDILKRKWLVVCKRNLAFR